MARRATSVARWLGAAVTAGGLLASVACSTSSSSATTKPGTPIEVVAGENFWGNIAEQIGGSHVKVKSIISDPNTDPHEYETDPVDAAAVARANVVIENGVGYDDFLKKVLEAAGGSRQVLNVADLVGAKGSDINPHLWYSPTYVKQAATAIEKQYATQDPANAAEFQANLATFLKAYQPYLDTIAEIRQKHDGAAISYTERVPGYLIQAAGLHLGTPASFSQSVEDGTDPTPRDTAEFNADLKQHKVKVLLFNGQVTDQQTSTIKKTANAAGVPIVGMTETIPAGAKDFQSWQISQAKALLSALGG